MKNNEIKIAILFPKDSIGFFNPESNITFGGATVQLNKIAAELHKQKIDILGLIPDIETVKSCQKIQYNMVNVYHSNQNLILKLLSTIRILNRYKPTFIFQRGISSFSLPFIWILKFFHIKSVFMFAHDIETLGKFQNSRKNYLFFKLLLKASSVLVCQNQLQKKNLPGKFQNKTFIFKKGIEIIKTGKTKKTYDAAWIARCEKWKNPYVFIELAKKFPDKKFCMVCSKSPNDADYFNDVRKEILTTRNIEFYYKVSHEKSIEILGSTKTFILTSDSEGDWPMTVLESASIGTPILSLNINIENSLNNFNFGIFCNGDREKLKQNFKKLLQNPQKAAQIGKNGQTFISEIHSIERNITSLLNELMKY